MKFLDYAEEIVSLEKEWKRALKKTDTCLRLAAYDLGAKPFYGANKRHYESIEQLVQAVSELKGVVNSTTTGLLELFKAGMERPYHGEHKD